MSELVRRFESDSTNTKALWRIASHQSAQIGDRVYLFKQGSDPRGVFGIGEIIERPRLQIDSADLDEVPRHRAMIRFDRLVDPSREFLIKLDAIQDILPDTLVTTQSSGVGVPENVALELEKRLLAFITALPSISNEQADDPGFDPDSIKDERERALRAIRLRRGQPAFRAALLDAYDRRCAITGCAVEDVLEAAHITPYLGGLTNHVSNGLLLRTDLHTLFDCGLLGIDPKNRTVVVAEALKSSSYAKLAGKTLRRPKEATSAPSTRNLEKRHILFEPKLKPRR
ncbi:HNH endonuclease [Bradyrhizobium sp. LVM 105]|uniref:HNH endonuclease n=1 Tax=Bradyrhizobium sp. LVM 105 TaxID=2341115 RepID=UPI00196B99CA|nr:HNH endonuclease [Bradyrhizobium sp. LVM 105]